MKPVEGTDHEKHFINYIRNHRKDSDYVLSVFPSWDYAVRDICFARMPSRMSEWESMLKGQFLYFDFKLSYIDYEALENDINSIYGAFITCNIYTNKNKSHVLFEFKENLEFTKKLALCMYMSLFSILRGIGNEFSTKIDDDVKIKTLREGLIIGVSINSRGNHCINEGLQTVYNDDLLLEPYIDYYLNVIKYLFSKPDKAEKLVKLTDSYFTQNLNYFPGQTYLFSVLEEVYHELRHAK